MSEPPEQSPDRPRLARGDLLTLSLEGWGRLGEALARHQGEDVFVFGGIPGERVVAQVLRVHRKYVGARVVEVLEGSPDRVEPRCPYYGDCTGCQWQHLDYQRQLAVKREKVVDALARVGGLTFPEVVPVLPAPEQHYYRNHARFTVGPEGTLGFVNRESRRFVRIDRCMLMHEAVNDLLSRLQDRCADTTQLSIRAGQETGDYLVQPRLKSPEVPIPTGQKHYNDSVDGRTFRVASPSFFQVNNQQAARLAQMVRDALGLQGHEVLLDAYTGVGTFAVLLAPHAGRVIAVEESSAAVEDARQNAAGLDNVEFLLGKTEEALPELSAAPDAVVLDPPRAGCKPEALEALLRLGPPRIAYVSCDPETLARDLKTLCGGQYVLERVEPLDMFPQTHHVEVVALLRRRAGDGGIVLASASPRRRELLSGMGLDFQVDPAAIDEEPRPGESGETLARRLSLEKATAVASRTAGRYVIGADSVVVLEGEALGKPTDDAEARRMLQRLRGARHQVVTGVTVVDALSGRRMTDGMTSEVAMRDFSDAEMEASIARGTPEDKAGAYAIQDGEFRPASLYQGCYTNVVGLPLCRLLEMLRGLGCPADLLEGVKVAEAEHCRAVCPFQCGGGP